VRFRKGSDPVRFTTWPGAPAGLIGGNNMTVRTRQAGALLLLGVAAAAALVLVVRPVTDRAEAAGQGAGKGSGADAEIRLANANYGAAMTAGDIDAIMAFWTADADYIDEIGKQTTGNDKIAALFRKAAPETKGSKVTIRVHTLKFLRPEVCLEDGSVERTLATGTKETNRFAIVWTKTGDKWLISSVRDLPTDVTDLPSVAAAYLSELSW